VVVVVCPTSEIRMHTTLMVWMVGYEGATRLVSSGDVCSLCDAW